MSKRSCLAVFCAVLFIVVSLGGCSKSISTSKTPTNFSTTNDKGEIVYLTQNDQHVGDIKKVAEQFAKEINDRDYTNMNGTVEYHLYTKQLADTLTKNGDDKDTVKIYTDNKIKSKYDGTDIKSMSFNKDLTECSLTFVIKSDIAEATDQFFTALNQSVNQGESLSNNTVFAREYRATLKLEQGSWKIDAVSAANTVSVVSSSS